MHSADVNNGTINYIQLHQMLFNPYALYTAKGTKDSIRSAMQTVVHTADLHVTTEVRDSRDMSEEDEWLEDQNIALMITK